MRSKGAPGVVGLTQASLIKLLKIHCSAWVPVLFWHHQHAYKPLGWSPGGHLLDYALADVVVEVVPHLVVEVVGNSGGYAFCMGRASGRRWMW